MSVVFRIMKMTNALNNEQFEDKPKMIKSEDLDEKFQQQNRLFSHVRTSSFRWHFENRGPVNVCARHYCVIAEHDLLKYS